VERYGQYGRKISRIVKRNEKCGGNPNWIVNRYGKYRRKVSWKVKRYGNYGKKSRLNSEKSTGKWNVL
jgi:hypothetical protein